MKVVVRRPPLPFLVLGIIFKVPLTKAGFKAGLPSTEVLTPPIPKFGMKTASANRTEAELQVRATGTSRWLTRGLK